MLYLLFSLLVTMANLSGNASKLSVTSTAFKNNGMIPYKYTCDGKNINPPVIIGNIPGNTASLAVIMEDQDSSGYVNWVMWNIPLVNKYIREHHAPGTEGPNSKGTSGYTGPCPFPGMIHHYKITAYAVDVMLDLAPGNNKAALLKAMGSIHILAKGELIGQYKKD